MASILEVYFNPRTHRYHYSDSKRFVPERVVELLTRRRIADGINDLKIIGNLLEQNKISLITWQETTAKTLREVHTQQYLLNRGGRKQMTVEDWQILKRTLRSELKLLRNFASDINNGYTIDSNGRQQPLTVTKFRARLTLYGKATQLSARYGNQQSKLKSGKQYVGMQRFLGATDRHCSSCLSYASLGIRPLGGLPLPGEDCECRANCLCRVKYYTAQEIA